MHSKIMPACKAIIPLLVRKNNEGTNDKKNYWREEKQATQGATPGALACPPAQSLWKGTTATQRELFLP